MNAQPAHVTMPLDRLEEIFRALADRTRLRILALVGRGEVCVCHIHDTLQLAQPTVSRHLAYLRRSGLVDARRDGVWVHYRLSPSLEPVVRAVVEAAIHALSHVPDSTRDLRQYQQTFGSLRVVPLTGSGPCCCSPPLHTEGVTGRPPK